MSGNLSLTTLNAIALYKTKQVSLATLTALCSVLDVEPGEPLERGKKRKGRRELMHFGLDGNDRELLLALLANDGLLDLTAPEDDAGYAAFEQRVKRLDRLGLLGLVNLSKQKNYTHASRHRYRVLATLSVEGRSEAERLSSQRGRG